MTKLLKMFTDIAKHRRWKKITRVVSSTTDQNTNNLS